MIYYVYIFSFLVDYFFGIDTLSCLAINLCKVPAQDVLEEVDS